MEKATEIFEKHWTKATGKPLDETTKQHMHYAIEAVNEALLLGDGSGALPLTEDEKAYIHWCTCEWCGNIRKKYSGKS